MQDLNKLFIMLVWHIFIFKPEWFLNIVASKEVLSPFHKAVSHNNLTLFNNKGFQAWFYLYFHKICLLLIIVWFTFLEQFFLIIHNNSFKFSITFIQGKYTISLAFWHRKYWLIWKKNNLLILSDFFHEIWFCLFGMEGLIECDR